MLKQFVRRHRWLSAISVVVLSFAVSGFIANPTHAATWVDAQTIEHNGNQYTGPKASEIQGNPGYIFNDSECNADGAIFFVVDDLSEIEASGTPVRLVKEVYMSSTGCTRTLGNTFEMTNERPSGAVDDPGGEVTEADENIVTCTVSGVGWIVCPAAEFLATITDGAYGLIERLMYFRPAEDPLDTSSNNPLYTVWSNIRTFANITFIVAFFMVIISQATSIGISAYGIRKMLPRIVVAAILINISYYITIFAVDLSNIIGAGLDGIIRSAITGTEETGAVDFTWSSAAALILAGAGATYLFLQIFAILALLLPAALLAILVTLVILVARQAILIILIILSPMAFAAYILPGTEEWFTKWKKLFITMLVFYPMVAILFAGSQVASEIMRDVATGESALIQVLSLGVLALPLFLTPFLIQFSGSLLGRIAGMVNNPNKGPFDRMRKGLEDRQGLRTARQTQQGRGFTGRIRRRSEVNKRKRAKEKAFYESGLESSATAGFANDMQENSSSLRKQWLSRGGEDETNRAEAYAKDLNLKLEADDVRIASARLENLDAKSLVGILESKTASKPEQAAALQRLIATADPPEYEKYVNKYGSDTSDGAGIMRRAMVESLKENGPKFLKAPDFDNIKNGTLGKDKWEAAKDEDGNIEKNSDGTVKYVKNGTNPKDLAAIAAANVRTGVLSQERMAADSNGNLNYAFDNAGVDGQVRMAETASQLLQNENLQGAIKHNIGTITTIASKKPQTNTQTTAAQPQATPTPPERLQAYPTESLRSMPSQQINMIINNQNGPSNMSTSDLSKLASAMDGRADTSDMYNAVRTELNNRSNNQPQRPSQPSGGSTDTSGAYKPAGASPDYNDRMQK